MCLNLDRLGPAHVDCVGPWTVPDRKSLEFRSDQIVDCPNLDRTGPFANLSPNWVKLCFITFWA
jgi:hypothetical protein